MFAVMSLSGHALLATAAHPQALQAGSSVFGASSLVLDPRALTLPPPLYTCYADMLAYSAAATPGATPLCQPGLLCCVV